MYTVKQLSDLAQISVRTLHYYDEISLLNPSKVGANGYRYYDNQSLLRLQQILFYREIGLELTQIKEILDSPDFDLLAALHSHRVVLQEKSNRLQNLIQTVDQTIQHLTGAGSMSKKQLFQAFSAEEQENHERAARLQYGPKIVNESIKRWNGYSKAQQEAIMEESNAIYSDLAEMMQEGKSAQSAEVQEALARWHLNIYHFYEPDLEILRGLGEVYRSDPKFIAVFEQLHADLPQYLHTAIEHYVDELETAELARMIAEDHEAQRNGFDGG